MASQRIKLNIPHEFSKYKSFSNRCRILHEHNPHLNIPDISGSKKGDIELNIALPGSPENEVLHDNTDDRTTPEDGEESILDALVEIDPCHTPAL